MWVWSKLSGIQWMDAWEERFYGNPNAVINVLKGGKSTRVEVYAETEQEVLDIQKQFGGSVRKLVHKNWAAMVEPDRPPIKIRSKMIVTQKRDAEARAELEKEFPGRHIVQIPADMAFGTGDHATTSNCLRFLVDVASELKKNGQRWDILDLGCGSGVLAIAARMLGADSGLALDFDPAAVTVAQRNVELNGQKFIDIGQADVLNWEPSRKYRVVVANLFSTVLQQAFPTIVESLEDDGYLIISGILKEQWPETQECAEEEGLVFSDVLTRGKWVSARARLG
ncbi:50S ribosomal protein L11 methyltransferase [Persicirhabdus sediminis]|uniref:50S ribosomal protein L11 methyltransferase n=2 Tax=Persicirhabdus sediminis TaxID=454144 RepID=A0A8J7MG41_9BACT|nr:50S ribosomal protein L11 methyltransferase [Persicirhabdus sediminis]